MQGQRPPCGLLLLASSANRPLGDVEVRFSYEPGDGVVPERAELLATGARTSARIRREAGHDSFFVRRLVVEQRVGETSPVVTVEVAAGVHRQRPGEAAHVLLRDRAGYGHS